MSLPTNVFTSGEDVEKLIFAQKKNYKQVKDVFHINKIILFRSSNAFLYLLEYYLC